MASSTSTKTATKGKSLTQEQIANGFNELRSQQRQMAVKISEITDEKKEHQLVIDTLKDMNDDRVCYRMVGGVLVQRTVGEVLPTLDHNLQQMTNLLEALEKQVKEKGKEILEYKEKHNIRLQSEVSQPEGQQKSSANSGDNKTGGVLVNS